MLRVMTRKRQTRFEIDVRLVYFVVSIRCEARLLFLFACISTPSSILSPHLLSAIQRTSFSRNSTSFLSIIKSNRVREV